MHALHSNSMTAETLQCTVCDSGEEPIVTVELLLLPKDKSSAAPKLSATEQRAI